MSVHTNERDTRAGRSPGARRGRVARLATAVGLTAGLVLTGTLGAAAGPVTSSVNWRQDRGTTSSGVSWVASGANAEGGITDGQTRDLTFSEPVTMTFDVISVNIPGECMRLPQGSIEPVRIHRTHFWNANTRQLCVREGVEGDTNAVSSFRSTGRLGMLRAVAVGGPPRVGRAITNLRVTVERDEAVLVDDEDTTPVDTPKTVDIQANDTIPEGSTGWEVDRTTTQGGTVADNGDGTITYTPPPGFTGSDTFTYRVTGPDGVEVEATVTIIVTEEEPPVPMVAPGMALIALAGTGLVAAVRRRKA